MTTGSVSPHTTLSSVILFLLSITNLILPCPILIQCSPKDTTVSSYQVSNFNIIPLRTSNENKTLNAQECWYSKAGWQVSYFDFMLIMQFMPGGR